MPERFCVFPWADTQRRACHWQLATRKLDMLNATHDIRDLKVPPGNRLEVLRGTWKEYHSIRINKLLSTSSKPANASDTPRSHRMAVIQVEAGAVAKHVMRDSRKDHGRSQNRAGG